MLSDTIERNGNAVREALRTYLSVAFSKSLRSDSLKKKRAQDIMYKAEKGFRDAMGHAPALIIDGEHCIFTGRIYEPFDNVDMNESIRELLYDHDITSLTFANIRDLTSSVMMSMCKRSRSVDQSVVVMGNGVFDTRDMSLHCFSDMYVANSYVSYNYRNGAHSDLWERFLDCVLPNKEHQRVLQEFVAACYLDRSKVKFEQMLILKGSGSNGKSVVFEIVSELIGDGNMCNFSISDLISKRRDQNVALIAGKRLNYCSEIRTTDISSSNADAFKCLVSGERMMARRLYGEPFKVSAIPLLMANANTLPKISEPTESLKRRFIIIPFDAIISEDMQDKELADRIKNEMPGIFNWAMEGLVRLRENDNRIYLPESIQNVVDEYFYDNFCISDWLRERRMFSMWYPQTTAMPKFINCAALYTDYCNWCKQIGEHPKTRNAVYAELDNLGFKKIRRNTGFGYNIYTVISAEEVRATNMELAASRERMYGLKSVKAEKDEMENVFVTGVDDAEKYLGLREGTIYTFFSNGLLDGSYISTPKGPRFNITNLQMQLASGGYYTAMEEDGDMVKRKSINDRRKSIRSFNKYMESLGEPFRMLSDVPSANAKNPRDCIYVPFGWKYSKDTASDFMEIMKLNQKNRIENG